VYYFVQRCSVFFILPELLPPDMTDKIDCPFCGMHFDQKMYDRFMESGCMLELEDVGVILLEAGSCLCGALRIDNLPDVI